MALFVGEAGAQEGPHQLPCQLDADHPGAEHQDVHVVVLDALMGRVGVVAEAGADAGELVRRDGGAHAAPADQHAPLHRARRAPPGQRRGHVRIVDRLRAVGPEVLDSCRASGAKGSAPA